MTIHRILSVRHHQHRANLYIWGEEASSEAASNLPRCFENIETSDVDLLQSSLFVSPSLDLRTLNRFNHFAKWFSSCFDSKSANKNQVEDKGTDTVLPRPISSVRRQPRFCRSNFLKKSPRSKIYSHHMFVSQERSINLEILNNWT